MIQVYGMSGCTTVTASRRWLDEQGYAHEYRHFAKVEDLAAALNRWIDATELTAILNTRAANFKKLSAEDQARLPADRAAAIAAMVQNPRLIKRPIAERDGRVIPGFDQAAWATLA